MTTLRFFLAACVAVVLMSGLAACGKKGSAAFPDETYPHSYPAPATGPVPKKK